MSDTDWVLLVITAGLWLWKQAIWHRRIAIAERKLNNTAIGFSRTLNRAGDLVSVLISGKGAKNVTAVTYDGQPLMRREET